ncbi:MAG: HAD family phosphatase [Deltaproteobacteria bacterium]|nr:HAD family phosphatase [Deltaproteobacteria bacterium]
MIFDWGGVLIDNPVEEMITFAARMLSVDPDLLRPSYLRYKLLLQDGRISEKMFWDHICGELDVAKPRISSLLDQSFRAVYRERKDVFALASRLHRRGYKTALLSNTEAPSVTFFHEKKYSMFDEAVFSCLEGVSKPDLRIYGTVLDRLGAQPHTVLFIDDSLENVRSAEQTGMVALLFKNPSRLRRELLALSMEI